MNTEQKWEYINSLDDKFLIGGVILSEWTACIVRDVDIAYCSHANLAAQAAIECHLRYEYSGNHSCGQLSFCEWIEQSPLVTHLKDRFTTCEDFAIGGCMSTILTTIPNCLDDGRRRILS